jgi:L-asparaginase
MKLLLIFTGGTIGSTEGGGTISVDTEKPHLLCRAYEAQYPIDFSYDILTPLWEQSENFSGAQISTLLKVVTEHIDAGYDGIIVTHGTDTLNYTAAALGYALGNNTIPVCLVSANYTLEDARSNALPNLHAAISLIRAGTEKGVFVPYRNGNEPLVQIHRATRLSASLSLADEVFSVQNCSYGYINMSGQFVKNPQFTEQSDALDAPDIYALTERSTGILRIFPYPGMVSPTLTDDIRAILLDTYHSGTMDGKSAEVHAFLKAAKEKNIPLFTTGDAAYESAQIFALYGVTRLLISPVAAYVKLWLYGPQIDLSQSRGGDVF